MTDRTVPTGPMPGNCTRCGFPWKEHTYNGACYGICGQFVAASPAAPGAEVAEAIHAARGFDPRDKSISGAGVPYGEWASTLKIAAAVAPFITGPGAEVQPVAFNINETVLVRLNDHGREIVRESDAKWSELYPRLRGHSTLPEEDADGWSKWQLWHLMKTFGPHMFAGAPNPFDITIRIPLPTTTDAIRAQARREALEGAMAAALSRKTEWARKAAEPGRSDHDVAVFESAASAADEIHEDIQRHRRQGGGGVMKITVLNAEAEDIKRVARLVKSYRDEGCANGDRPRQRDCVIYVIDGHNRTAAVWGGPDHIRVALPAPPAGGRNGE